MPVLTVSLALLSVAQAAFGIDVLPALARRNGTEPEQLDVPPNAQYFPPSSYIALSDNSSFRASPSTPWSPPSASPEGGAPAPFQIYHPSFLSVLGSSPRLRVIASDDTYAFAHEAPIWLEDTDELVFCSNAGGKLGQSGLNQNNRVFKVALGGLDNSDADANLTVTELDIQPPIQMTNGGTFYRGQLLFAIQGRGERPGGLNLVSASAPYNSSIVVNNFFGRQFNSPNDVVIHGETGAIFFTDTKYGFFQDFRPAPLLPDQVYYYNPSSGVLRALADGFGNSNGIAFSPDFKHLYLADTGAGTREYVPTQPASIYVFDVVGEGDSVALSNRRLFAYVDTRLPDGLKVDTAGNLYAGTGDGVQVWDPSGILLGKIFLNTTSANLVFAGKGRLAILAETKIYLADLAAEGVDLDYAF